MVLLTNRLNYRDKRKFNQLRSDISTIAVAEFRKPVDILSKMAVPEVATMQVNHQRTATQIIPASSHGIRLVAELSEVHTKAHRHYSKKIGKKHRRKFGRSHRA